MSDGPSVTTREAVLGSLLAHACLIIYVLVFPGTFAPGSPLVPRATGDDETKIPVTFKSPLPDDNGPSLGDSGEMKSSEPRPPDAPPPRNEDPYSIGNTRNRFMAPPLPEKTTPGPEPGYDPMVQDRPGADRSSDAEAEAAAPGQTGEESQEGAETDGQVPTSPGAGKTAKQRGQRDGSIRQALGKMTMGMSGGGTPLKFDNPTGGVSGPTGGLSFETKDFDWGPYARRIYWVIWSNWMRGWPPAAWAGLKGVVGVRFRIWKDGRISDIEVLSSSGTEAFDTCATLALEASNPLPPLPADFTKESEGITARFLYNTDLLDE